MKPTITMKALVEEPLDRNTPVTKLRAAAAAAKTARLAEDPKAKIYRFAVNYRLDETTRTTTGDYHDRYDRLVALIHALDGKPWHSATSSWEIFTHLSSATVLARLSAPLDDKIDVLTVTPVGASKVFGDSKKLKG